MVIPLSLVTILLVTNQVSSQNRKKEKSKEFQNDLPREEMDFDFSGNDIKDILAEVKSSMNMLIDENKVIRRRLNRVIQENVEINSKLSSLEAEKIMTEMSSKAPMVQMSPKEAPMVQSAPFDMSIIHDLTAAVDDVKLKCAKTASEMDLNKEQVNDAMVFIENFKIRSEMIEKRRTINMNELTSKIHRRFILLERRVGTTETMRMQPNQNYTSSSSLSSTIQSIVSRLPIHSLARSDIKEIPTQLRIEENVNSVPAREFTNMAKVMWELPKTCIDLFERGLNAKDSGRYIIRPDATMEPFIVTCDFLRERTIIHFGDSLEDNIQNFDPCSGSDCSKLMYSYQPNENQIAALKDEMRHCKQTIQFECNSSSISDRVNWIGNDGSQNIYFSGNGEFDGCGCSMGEQNECEGGYLCNCDASDLGDVGAITNKEALPILSLSATDVNSTASLSVTIGKLECWGRPGWTQWASWSVCDASCTGGFQMRSRVCEGSQDKCFGESFQTQECNVIPCPEWADWSSWSRCIDTETKLDKPCGQKERFRLCEGDGRCPGDTFEHKQCDCVLVLGGNGHKLNASLIDYETDLEYQVDLGSRIRMPALTAHCMVKFHDRVFVIGGWNTRTTVFELRDCGLFPLRLRLPREYRVHSCSVHDDQIWVCGTRDAPHSCDSFDTNWNHLPQADTLFPHSYGSMVDSYRGLAIIGGVSSLSGRNDKVEFNQKGTWREGPSLPTRLSSHTSHNIDGDLYVLGGLVSDTGILGQSDRVFRLSKNAPLWEVITRLKSSRSHHASVALPNGAIMLIGDPYVTAKVELYSNSTSIQLSVSHEKRAFPAAVFLDRPVC